MIYKNFFCLVLLGFFVFLNAKEGDFGKDFYDLNISEKRRIFILKMNEMLDLSFEKIKKESDFVRGFFKKNFKDSFRNAEPEELKKLRALQEKYRIKNIFDFKAYEEKIAPLPRSMAIAQGILESGTGTSRFVREGNNIFGEWTWGKDGLLPKKRSAGQKHRVRIFKNLQESVDSYLLNINRHFAYENLRKARLKARQEKRIFTGLEAIKSLHNYSQIGKDYEARLRQIILKYDLEKYDFLKGEGPFLKGQNFKLNPLLTKAPLA